MKGQDGEDEGTPCEGGSETVAKTSLARVLG